MTVYWVYLHSSDMKVHDTSYEEANAENQQHQHYCPPEIRQQREKKNDRQDVSKDDRRQLVQGKDRN